MSSQLPSPGDLPNVPWWQPGTTSVVKRSVKNQSNSFFIVTSVVIALIAGGVGATIGRTTSSNISGNFVSTENVVERAPGSIAGLASRVIPGVVSISVDAGGDSGTGSGFFLSSDGFVLTNNHVVEAAANRGRITVAISTGTKYTATIVGRDSSYDLAVLKIDVTGAPTLQLGDSDKAQVGDAVIAIGSPLGLAGTVTSGILSAKNRAVTTGSGFGDSSFINALQTDAAINPGNSGGPLVDSQGRIVGVNSAIATLGSGSATGNIGLGFSIPFNQAKRIIDEIISTGKSTKPIFGVSFDSTFTGTGARIGALTAGKGAEKAGIPANSVIKSIDGFKVNNAVSAIVRIRSKAPGDQVTVIVELPNGTSRTYTVTLDSAPSL